jgi:uncharacterized protein (DUF1499 family)
MMPSFHSSPLRRYGRFASVLAVSGLLAACAAPGAKPVDKADASYADLACFQPSNCVSSLSGNGPEPLRFEGSAEGAMAALKGTLAGFPEAKIESAEGNAMAVIFTTAVGFKDRVDFRIDAPRQRIDFRSRSLLGLYDFGKNRSRMAAFAERFEATRAR